ncbi:DUF2637 domain-containing protein [Paractinoplanes brasiliensis]|uniref:DUF2637 domain-containing protein n=1 Tax=Paractinoplanes brasiliensis TaxID=52695 RepID=UPI001A57B935|nr:DUF2637 domain-containing protein [Actinoplanes brasiliensis]GID29547.1 hypothetical protein Abr02nite_45300 [Actinoplanes brasiliensis]
MHDVAEAHGQPGWLAWADAIVLELMSVAGGLELRRRKRLGAHLWFPAVVLIVAVVLSLGAQVVEAEPSVIGWLAAALPAVGFLAMVKIALGRADHGPVATVPASAAVPDGPGRPQQPPTVADDGPSPTTVDDEMGELLPVARKAAGDLAREGRPLSREALAEVLRRQGHAMSNARASALVKLIRDQPTRPKHPTGDGDAPLATAKPNPAATAVTGSPS